MNHTKSIGLLATSSEAPYFAEVIEAVENSCYSKGYTLILCNSHNNLDKQKAYLAMLAQKRVDGLLVMCSEYPDQLLGMLEDYRNIPMVVMDWGTARGDFTDSIIDNAFEGGYLAGRYLIERGHRDMVRYPASWRVIPAVAVIKASLKPWKKPISLFVKSGLFRAILSQNPVIKLCIKF